MMSAIRALSRLTSVGAGPLVATAVANAVIAACGLVSGTLLARMLGAEGRGELAAIQSWPMLLTAIGSVGLTEAAAYFAAKAPERARTTLASATIFLLPFSVAAVAVGHWILPYALQSQTPDVQWGARISLLLVPLMALVSAPQQALRGAGQYTAWNLLRILVPLGWVAALVFVRTFADAGVTTAAIAFVVVTAAAAGIGYACAWRLLAGAAAPTASLAGPMLSYGVPTVVSALPQWLNVRFDQLVMISLVAPHSLGLYAVAVAWSGAAQPLASVLALTAVPVLASSTDGPRRARVLYRSGAMVAITASALLLVATPLLVPFVFGADFRAAVPAAMVLVVAGAIAGINAVGGECLRGLGRPRAVLVAECVGLAVTFVAVLALIPIAGIVGAALASVASYSAVLVVQHRLISAAGHGSVIEPGLLVAVEAPPR